MHRPSRRQLKGPRFQPSFSMNTIKDLVKAKLDFKFPQGYSDFTLEQKQLFWKQKLEELSIQQQKIVYWLPDSLDQKDVELAISIIKKYYTQNLLLDYQYQKTFVTNLKKQLLVYRNCGVVKGFLSKYRLPKEYEDQVKKISKDAEILSESIIQRNEFISLGQDQKVQQLSGKVMNLRERFDNSFTNFAVLMNQIFQHFKQQNKREQILLIAIRESVIEKLREVTKKAGLFLRYRFSETDGDQFKDIVIKKQNDYSNEDDSDIKSQSSRKSSVVQSSFQSEQQQTLQIPKGIDYVQFIELSQHSILFKVHILSQTKKSQAEVIQVQEKQSKFFKIFPIKGLKQNCFNIQIEYSKKGYVEYVFSTKNDAGSSFQKETIKLNLNLEDDLILCKKKSVYFIQGKDKSNDNGILSKQKIVQNANTDLNKFTMPAVDLSLSSKHVMICDSMGSVACWGALYSCLQQPKPEEIQKMDQLIRPQSYTFTIQSPSLLMSHQKKIIKVSCGFGYGLLLDIFGKVWSYGLNTVGQLGLGSEFQAGEQQPQIITTFNQFRQRCFIVDIHATESGASFAIDSEGMLYRWGANQVNQTINPVYDRFGSIINYSTNNLLLKQFKPIPIKKKYCNQKIIKVVSGNQFALALNNNGDLYGWGQCYSLGIGKLFDKNEQEVQNICNPLQIMKGVQNVVAGYDHAIVVLKDNTIKGWGLTKYLSNLLDSKRQYKPIDLTHQYGNLQESDIIQCGKTYTAIYRKGEIKIFGQNAPFQKKNYIINKKIQKLICSDKYMAFLSEYEQTSI